jgi:hypothetical protein
MDKKEQLVDIVIRSAKKKSESDDRRQLTCAEAFKLAKENGAAIGEIGRICNQNKIRICKCQLGCFV